MVINAITLKCIRSINTNFSRLSISFFCIFTFATHYKVWTSTFQHTNICFINVPSSSLSSLIIVYSHVKMMQAYAHTFIIIICAFKHLINSKMVLSWTFEVKCTCVKGLLCLTRNRSCSTQTLTIHYFHTDYVNTLFMKQNFVLFVQIVFCGIIYAQKAFITKYLYYLYGGLIETT